MSESVSLKSATIPNLSQGFIRANYTTKLLKQKRERTGRGSTTGTAIEDLTYVSSGTVWIQ
jgi:hypothetical protein